MHPDRREFLKHLGWLSAAGGALAPTSALASGQKEAPPEAMGVLVDLTHCVGCRLCEYACKKANEIDPGPLESYDDPSVFARMRRPAPDAYTVVNAWPGAAEDGRPVYAKVNCMHCNHAACVSACIVGALRKQDNGAVTYDAWKCMGCRYCMAACPFQIPAYSYDDAFTPEVRKCEFCTTRTAHGEKPACVAACPRESLTFGKRETLLAVAHERINAQPDRYVDHVYGEHEVGGTSWMYLSPVAFSKAGFLDLPMWAPPALTESIQHGVFKHGLPPLALYGTLGAIMYFTRRRERVAEAAAVPVEHPRSAVATIPYEPPESPGEHPHFPGEFDADEHGEEHHDEEPRPVERTLLTPGVLLLAMLTLVGLAFGIYRFIFGLGASTNLNQQYPWGLWIAIDVASGVALAAGGFTSAALTHVFHRERYHAIARPALLTAMLGYTFVVLGLQADLGRYYNVWHPLIMWQGNSVLFEVGMCVTCYLNVLYLEFAPIFCERLIQEERRFPRLSRLAAWAYPRLEKIMFLLVIAGCVLSCLHQSSLGNLLVIAPSKLHPLWWTPISPLLFLLSAIALGFPMVIWESLFASWSLKLKPEMKVLSPLARFVPILLGIYLCFKLGDMAWRGTYVYLDDGSLQSLAWMLEVGLGVVLPMALLLVPALRRRTGWLFIAASLVVGGVILNRVNVFLIGYRPPFADGPYIPSIGEVAVTVGLFACMMLTYRVIVTFFPVISQPREKAAA